MAGFNFQSDLSIIVRDLASAIILFLSGEDLALFWVNWLWDPEILQSDLGSELIFPVDKKP